MCVSSLHLFCGEVVHNRQLKIPGVVLFVTIMDHVRFIGMLFTGVCVGLRNIQWLLARRGENASMNGTKKLVGL